MTKVTRLPCITTLHIPADTILESAMGKLDGAVVMGWDEDGTLYFASSYANGGEVLWLMEKAKKDLLDIT